MLSTPCPLSRQNYWFTFGRKTQVQKFQYIHQQSCSIVNYAKGNSSGAVSSLLPTCPRWSTPPEEQPLKPWRWQSEPAAAQVDLPCYKGRLLIHALLLLLLLSRFNHVQLYATPQTAAHQAPPSLGFSRQKYWSGLPLPSPWSMLYKIHLQLCFRNLSTPLCSVIM